jgi:hypothetical protein
LSGKSRKIKRVRISHPSPDWLRRIFVSVVVSLVMGVFVNPRLIYIINNIDSISWEWLQLIIPAIVIMTAMFLAYPYLEKIPIMALISLFWKRLVKHRKSIIFSFSVLLIIFIPVFLIMNDGCPFASNYLSITSIEPQFGLDGRTPVYANISVEQRGLGWGRQNISFALYPIGSTNRAWPLDGDERGVSRVFSYRLWGNRNIMLFNDYYFSPHRSYVLRIYVNGEFLDVAPMNTINTRA